MVHKKTAEMIPYAQLEEEADSLAALENLSGIPELDLYLNGIEQDLAVLDSISNPANLPMSLDVNSHQIGTYPGSEVLDQETFSSIYNIANLPWSPELDLYQNEAKQGSEVFDQEILSSIYNTPNLPWSPELDLSQDEAEQGSQVLIPEEFSSVYSTPNLPWSPEFDLRPDKVMQRSEVLNPEIPNGISNEVFSYLEPQSDNHLNIAAQPEFTPTGDTIIAKSQLDVEAMRRQVCD